MIENHDCFLEDDPWQSTLQSASVKSQTSRLLLSDCDPIITSLWKHLCSIPSLYKEVQTIICEGQFLDASAHERIFSRTNYLLNRMLLWCTDFESQYMVAHEHPSLDYAKSDKRIETYGVCLASMIILYRLKVALEPLNSSSSEDESQKLARCIMALEKQARTTNPRAALFLALKLEITRATLATENEWRPESCVDARVGLNGYIAPWVFRHWCALKGRRI